MAESKSEGVFWEDDLPSELEDDAMVTLLTLLELLELLELVLDLEVLESLDGGMKSSAATSWRNLESQACLKEQSASSS
jgi:hypothetical protein